MGIAGNLGYTIGAIIVGLELVVGLFGLITKNSLYGKTLIIPALILYTFITLTFGAGLIYIIRGQILSDDSGTQAAGITGFVGLASALVLVGGALVLYILGTNDGIHTQMFNYFTSVLILQFCLMTTISVVINKARIL